ncbi:Chromosome partition protein Smc [compost metagenome]
MRIKEIEIDNFKSFARPTKIQFLEGFTAITGPNGSGKSNVIDSVLFCLGLSNSKALRAEKLTDLINHNTGKREAKVTIRFGGGKPGAVTEAASAKEAAPGAEEETLEVARRIRENDNGYVSTYYLNGKTCTLTELHDTLLRFKVSPAGYNVVMQGDVSRIITMTATERRKIIDEVAGVAEFDARVNQAQKELDKVNEQEDKFALILTEITERLVQLQGERDHALKYKTLREERDRLEALCKLSVVWDLKAKIAGLEEMITSAAAREEQLLAAVREAQGVLEVKQGEYEALSEQIRQKGEDDLLALQTQLEETKGQIERERSAREFLNTQRADLERLSERDEEQIERHNARLEDLDDRRKDAVERRQRYEEDLVKAKLTYEEANKELESLYASHQESAKKGAELRARYNAVKDRYNEVWREKLRIEDSSHRATERIDAWKAELATHQDGIKGLSKEIEGLQGSVEEFQTRLKEDEKDLAAIGDRQRQAQSDLAEFEASANKARDAYFRADAKMKASEEGSFGRAVETILNAGIQGVHGTLAQLGSASEEYASALEVAAGGKLRFIVVDDDRIAARCIELLKERRAGRATFLPLNKLQAPRRLVPTGEDGVIGYAVNLVEFDSKYAAAFHHAFGDTLIVRHMDYARPLMGKHRMVTLDGDLLERSGAMTGGSDGRTSSLRFTASIAKELEEAKEVFEAALKRLARRKELIETIGKDGEAIKLRQRESQDGIREKQFELADRQRRIQQIRDQIVGIEGQMALAETEHEGVDAKLNVLEEQLAKLDEEQVDLELAISDIDELIDDARVEELSSTVNRHDFTVKQLESNRNNCDFTLKEIQLEEESINQAIAQLTEELARRKEAFVELEAKAQTIDATLKACADTLNALERQRDAMRERLGQLQVERERKAEEVRQAEKVVADKQKDMDRLMEGVNATRAQVQELSPQLAEMENELWLAGIEPPQEAPAPVPTEELKRQISRLEGRMRDMEPVNMLAIEAFDRESARQADLHEKVDKLREERLSILERIEQISLQKKTSFMMAFDQVSSNFSDIFSELAAGSGMLVLENPEDPFDGGLIIRAQPKDKKMQRLEAMSGGEKSLTALAFLFAFQRYQPAPFYAFDEVDAALDGVNAERLAVMLQTQAQVAQCIVISHRRPMLERSDQTIGISARTDGATRVLGVKWGGAKSGDAKVVEAETRVPQALPSQAPASEAPELEAVKPEVQGAEA